MDQKIPGKFLRIKEIRDHEFRIEFVLDGKPDWVIMETGFMVSRSVNAKNDIVKLNEKLLSLPENSDEKDGIKYFLQHAYIEALWSKMYVAHLEGKNLSDFFEQSHEKQSDPSMNTHANISFGIPITKGKILATGKNGVVVSFNLRYLLLNKLLRAQLYSSEQQTLTIPISPHVRVTDIYNYPVHNSIVDFAFAQQEYTAIVFVNTPRLTFSDKVRIVFWFQRYPMQMKKDTDRVDVPDEFIPLLIAQTAKQMCLHVGKPVPEDVEKTIEEETKRIKSTIPIQNYYVADTFNLSGDDLNKLDKEDSEIEKMENGNNDTENRVSLKKFGHGELKKKLKELLRADQCKKSETVPSIKIARWVRKIIDDGYSTNESTIRARLSKMGYSAEKQ